MAETSQAAIISIPLGYSARQRKQIGEDIINFIVRRTQSGLDVNNNFFSPYAKSYEKTGTVDLTVTEQMLGTLEVLSQGPGYIKIGFGNIAANNKASYIQNPRGQKSHIAPRKFVGISQSDLNRILKNYDR